MSIQPDTLCPADFQKSNIHTSFIKDIPDFLQTVPVNEKKNAEFIDSFLQLKSNLLPSFIKDAPDFLQTVAVNWKKMLNL